MDKTLSKTENQTLYIMLNYPDKLNCIGMEMLDSLNDEIIKAEADKNIRTVVFQGAGDRAFSTGADVKEFQSLENQEIDEWIEYGNKVFNKIENLPKPTIALIQGYALGGGLELALTCDLRIATENAIFSSPELQHGWLPGWGGMTRLRRLIGEAKTKELIFLSEKVAAKEAFKLGLVNKIIDSKNLEDSLDLVLKTLKNIDPLIFKLAKRAIMDDHRTTHGSEIDFNVMAVHYAKGLGE